MRCTCIGAPDGAIGNARPVGAAPHSRPARCPDGGRAVLRPPSEQAPPVAALPPLRSPLRRSARGFGRTWMRLDGREDVSPLSCVKKMRNRCLARRRWTSSAWASTRRRAADSRRCVPTPGKGVPQVRRTRKRPNGAS